MGSGRIIAFFACACLASAQTPLPLSPTDLIRKAIANAGASFERTREWTYTRESFEKTFDNSGKPIDQQSKTEELVYAYGRPIEKLIAKNGKPLSSQDEEKERARIEKLTAKWATESVEIRKTNLNETAQKERKDSAFLNEVPDAYTFKLTGEEAVNGRPAWIFDVNPRSDFRPKQSRAAMLSKFKGRVWVDQGDIRISRVECESIDTVSFGYFIARVQKGAHLSLFQARMEPNVWLMQRFKVRFDARLGLIKMFHKEFEQVSNNFRRFSVQSSITQ